MTMTNYQRTVAIVRDEMPNVSHSGELPHAVAVRIADRLTAQKLIAGDDDRRLVAIGRAYDATERLETEGPRGGARPAWHEGWNRALDEIHRRATK